MSTLEDLKIQTLPPEEKKAVVEPDKIKRRLLLGAFAVTTGVVAYLGVGNDSEPSHQYDPYIVTQTPR